MKRDQLADFPRRLRARIAPADVGLPQGARRRTPGLRREEVYLCGHEAPKRLATSGMARIGLLSILDQLTESAATVVSELGIALAQNFLAQVPTGLPGFNDPWPEPGPARSGAREE